MRIIASFWSQNKCFPLVLLRWSQVMFSLQWTVIQEAHSVYSISLYMSTMECRSFLFVSVFTRDNKTGVKHTLFWYSALNLDNLEYADMWMNSSSFLTAVGEYKLQGCNQSQEPKVKTFHVAILKEVHKLKKKSLG